MVRIPLLLAQLEAGSVVLKGVKRTLVTSPAVADQPWQRWKWPKVDALFRDDHYITSALCTKALIEILTVMAIIRELGYRKFWATWVSKVLTVEHKTTQGKHLCKTSPAQRERRRCFSVKNNLLTTKHGFIMKTHEKNNQWNYIISHCQARKNSSSRLVWVKS